MFFVCIFLLYYAVSSPHLTFAVVCIPGEELLLSFYLSLSSSLKSKVDSLGWHVPPWNSFHLHQIISLSMRKKYLNNFQKLTHLPLFLFSSLLLFFSLLHLKYHFNFCFPFTSLPCHKMYPCFSIKTVTTFSPLLIP